MLTQEREESMSVVIVGGNECMERQYKDLCAMYDCKAKVYTKKLTASVGVIRR